MVSNHSIDIYNYKELWDNIKEFQDITEEMHQKKKTIMKVKRTKYLEYWKPRLKAVKEDTEAKFKLIYMRTT